MKSYFEQNFPISIIVRVQVGEEVFYDAVRGLNGGHALCNAGQNWPYGDISGVGVFAAPDIDNINKALDFLEGRE